MKLKEVLKEIDSAIVFEIPNEKETYEEVLVVNDSDIVFKIPNEKETYDSNSAIPEERMNHIVISIQPGNKNIIIVATKPPKVKTLEELGYSFETGV